MGLVLSKSAIKRSASRRRTFWSRFFPGQVLILAALALAIAQRPGPGSVPEGHLWQAWTPPKTAAALCSPRQIQRGWKYPGVLSDDNDDDDDGDDCTPT